MNPMKYILLALTGVLPVAASAALVLLQKKGKLSRLSYWKQQILTGLIFGLIAVIATEFGISYNETVINARDAAPLCAGLIFGAPVGIIAGTIGAAERWFAVYWGVGTFTRAACTISTFLAGLIAAAMRRFMFDDDIPTFGYMLLIGIVTEVIHMLMIILTNLSLIKTAFTFVKLCTLPMVIINSLSVAASVYIVRRILGTYEKRTVNKRIPTISELFHSRLLRIVLLAYFATTFFTYFLQRGISEETTERLFELTMSDVLSDAQNKCNNDMLQINRQIADEIAQDQNADLNELKQRYDVYDISILSKEGRIVNSTNSSHIGAELYEIYNYPMFYTAIFEGKADTEYVSEISSTKYNPALWLKESGVKSDDVIVQIFYDEKHTFMAVENRLPDAVSNRHIGENGGLIVMDEKLNVLCSTIGLLYNPESNDNYEVKADLSSMKENALNKCRIGDTDYYCMYREAENCILLSVLPVSEANFTKDLSIHLNFFLLTIIFGALFVMIFITIKSLVAGSINKVNDSLSEITCGNLDTAVDVRTSREFIELSDDINSTVDTLKRYIAEANTRIDTELKYAREIQSSALPSVFPDREEIDLYALMDPAREVGGDFYDFYFIGRNKMVFMVADVSGKGIPASLFMMRAKTILKTYAENRIAVADIFTNANYQLCDGNETSMFVTAWMGILDLVTGELKYVNAGHNPPLIRRKGGSFEYLRERSGLVLAGIEGITYKEHLLKLQPGDEIFLYTDGVVEATDCENQLYGEQRLLDCMNAHKDECAKDLCRSVLADVDSFYSGAPQFDDITELSVKFKRYAGS